MESNIWDKLDDPLELHLENIVALISIKIKISNFCNIFKTVIIILDPQMMSWKECKFREGNFINVLFIYIYICYIYIYIGGWGERKRERERPT
jgi:hypothetical protein